VATPARTQVIDPSEVQFRRDTISAGARLSYLIFAAGIIYAAATWEQPHRELLAGLFALLALGGLVMSRLPVERIVRGRLREPVFLMWSFFSVAVTAGVVAADGGAESPLMVLFLLPVVFAALSYPLPSVAAVGAVSELTLVGVGTAVGQPDPSRLTIFATSLGVVAVLCAWQAELADRRRRELALVSRADPLTGCLNRRGFEERLAAELDEGLRAGRPLALVMFDLDGFKEINDTQGHAAGDELLCWTVKTIQDTIRPMDSVGRLGGDEFVVLLPASGRSGALSVAERIREALAPRVAATPGVAAFPTHGIEAEALLDHADAELYEAKEGRAPRDAPNRRELSWAATLARAVEMRLDPTMARDTSRRIANHAAAVGNQLGWSGPELGLLRLAAMLQDVGKVSLPDHVLRSPELNSDEREEVRKHPIVGAQLVERVEGLETIGPWIRHSHENFDGSGYPDGLAGEAIPPASRILRVVDAFDSLVGDRGNSEEEALAGLRDGAGTLYDPECVDALERALAASTTAMVAAE
jgi:diguanylate cyclase (GGDEF)-like protein